MSEEHPHPLLQQLPLTVSPYLSLPTATPLPYTYKAFPSTLPPSIVDVRHNDQSSDTPTKPTYVVSAGGHSAHPDSIMESCRALQTHLEKMQSDSEATVQRWSSDLREKELAEKRRVAPGWLDVGEESRILVPQRKAEELESGDVEQDPKEKEHQDNVQLNTNEEGDALDRAFGGMKVS